jgi:CDP-diacylglycerol---serine O-phosphatidyltransferase
MTARREGKKRRVAETRERMRRRLGGHFSMIREFHLADFFTLGNGCCGMGAVFLAMGRLRDGGGDGAVLAATGLIVLALVFDVFDGRVARWRHRASPMGRELDSLADVISFGVAPACLGYSIGLMGFWDLGALLYFVACGISRLARYNVTAEKLAGGSDKVAYFEGTPIPTSVLLVLLIGGLAWAGRIDGAIPGGATTFAGQTLHWFALLYVLSGSLMISKTLRIPKP